jgi:hypothetical protein
MCRPMEAFMPVGARALLDACFAPAELAFATY